jgi:hypothetical protein
MWCDSEGTGLGGFDARWRRWRSAEVEAVSRRGTAAKTSDFAGSTCAVVDVESKVEAHGRVHRMEQAVRPEMVGAAGELRRKTVSWCCFGKTNPSSFSSPTRDAKACL